MIKNPRWREEIDTYRSIKSAFVVEGNISDLQMYSSGGFWMSICTSFCSVRGIRTSLFIIA